MRELSLRFLMIALLMFVSGADLKIRDASEMNTNPDEVSHVSLVQGPPEPSVRDELAKEQKKTGLTIAWYDHVLSAVSFNKRSAIVDVRLPFLAPSMMGAVSPDGRQFAGYVPDGPSRVILGIVRFDGSDLRKYQGIVPVDFCWSHDNTSIALTNAKGRSMTSMEILNVSTKDMRLIQPNVDERWHFNSQCWSPDDKQNSL
jgi:hypothetical protein